MGLFKKNKNPENLQDSKKSQLKAKNSKTSICSCGCELSGQEHFCPKCGEPVEIKEETNFVQIKSTKTIKEIYKEKKRQLKIEQANLDREWAQFNQNTDISAIETELTQIQQKIENIKIKNVGSE